MGQMADLPEPFPLCRTDPPVQEETPVVPADLGNKMHLVFQPPLAVSIELHQQCGRFFERESPVPVEDTDDVRIEELHGPRSHSGTHDLKDCPRRLVNGRESGPDSHESGGKPHQLQGGFGYDAQGAFRTGQKAAEIISGRTLAGAAACLDHLTIGQDGGQAHHIIPGGAVLYAPNPAGVVPDHPANRRRRSGIRGEEEPFGLQNAVEFLVDHPGFHIHLEILRPDGQDSVHFLQIEDDSSRNGDGVSLQRTARPPGGHGDPLLEGMGDDPADFIGAPRPENDLGKTGLVEGFIMGMEKTDRFSPGKPLPAHDFGQMVDIRFFKVRSYLHFAPAKCQAAVSRLWALAFVCCSCYPVIF
ncbi:MAG: hypothetical protein A4E72_00122 [Syntrophus sp. PtaU1.Bin208]|nr:MAG: hypothetical protein A4E72_00122 [Syntrophus sp. PtaU1.Bin208]